MTEAQKKRQAESIERLTKVVEKKPIKKPEAQKVFNNLKNKVEADKKAKEEKERRKR
jgi:hypothetical protein